MLNIYFFFIGKEVGKVSRGEKNIPTRLAPNCHLHRLPPTLYILIKKGENNMYKRGD